MSNEYTENPWKSMLVVSSLLSILCISEDDLEPGASISIRLVRDIDRIRKQYNIAVSNLQAIPEETRMALFRAHYQALCDDILSHERQLEHLTQMKMHGVSDPSVDYDKEIRSIKDLLGNWRIERDGIPHLLTLKNTVSIIFPPAAVAQLHVIDAAAWIDLYLKHDQNFIVAVDIPDPTF